MKQLYKNLMFVVLAVGTNASADSGKQNSSLDIYAAEIVERTDPKVGMPGDNPFVFIGDGPLAADVPFAYEIKQSSGKSIDLILPEEAIEAINDALVGKQELQLAFTHRGQVFFTPLLRESLRGDHVTLSFTSVTERKRVESILRRAAASYR